MIYGLYNSAAGMLTSEYNQSVLANNIANADTVGFKPDHATFAERLPARLAGVRHGPSAVDLENLTGGLWLGQTHTDFSAGTKVKTDNWHDVALEGPGFLMVQGDGQVLYTRDGRMLMDRDGRLVAASDGAAMLGRAGQPIRLNPRGGVPSIDTQGRISQDGRIVAELGLADFKDHRVLRKAGAARFVGPKPDVQRPPTLVLEGYTESSGTKPLTELVSMIEASRAYQINARMVMLQDESVGRLISTVLRP